MKKLGCKKVKSPNSHRNFLTELSPDLLAAQWIFFDIIPKVTI